MSCSWLITWFEQSIPYKNMIQFLLNEGLNIDVAGRELCKSKKLHYHAVVSGQKKGGAQALRKGLRQYRKFLQLPLSWWDDRKGIQISMINNYGNSIQYCKKDGNYKENVGDTDEIARNVKDGPERLQEVSPEYHLNIPVETPKVQPVRKTHFACYAEFISGENNIGKIRKTKK